VNIIGASTASAIISAHLSGGISNAEKQNEFSTPTSPVTELGNTNCLFNRSGSCRTSSSQMGTSVAASNSR
jgi:hypothetical protein